MGFCPFSELTKLFELAKMNMVWLNTEKELELYTAAKK